MKFKKYKKEENQENQEKNEKVEKGKIIENMGRKRKVGETGQGGYRGGGCTRN